MIDVGLKNIKKAYGAFEILTDVSFDIHTNEKIGLIGRNGTGKTTIFKIISGREDINEGLLSIRKNIRISCLDQISEYPEYFTVEDVLNSAFEKLYELKDQLETMGKQLGESQDEELEKLLEKYGEMQNEFENLGGYEIDTKKSKICTGLKITEEFLAKDFSVLSGGEKTIVNLGKILLENPEVLLLDEPSNHLDINAIEWLEEYLKNYKGSIVIVSHDRYFLDRTVNKIIELEDGTSDVFHGNFSYYKVEKERRLLAEFEAYKDQQRKVNAMKEAIKRYIIWARGDHDKFFKKAKELQKRLDKIEMLDKPQLERKGIGLAFNGEKRSGKNVVICKKLSKSFDSGMVFEKIDMNIYFKERVALLGKNGCGKSTLLKIILGQLSADSGSAELGASVKFAYLDQNIEFDDASKTVLETYKEECKVYEGVARNQLSNFLFTKDEVFKKISELSGGERTRLKLALLMQNDTNLLILDEPTNHLDIDSKEMLEEALKEFNGTILFVSHDRYFINQISNKIVEMTETGLDSYEGDYDYYKECKAKQEVQTVQPEKIIKVKPSVVKKEKSKYTIEQTEKKIEQIENEIDDLSEIMRTNPDDHEKVTQAYNEVKKLEEVLETLYGEL